MNETPKEVWVTCSVRRGDLTAKFWRENAARFVGYLPNGDAQFQFLESELKKSPE